MVLEADMTELASGLNKCIHLKLLISENRKHSNCLQKIGQLTHTTEKCDGVGFR